MRKKYIKIFGITDVTSFVRKASEVDGDITVYRGKYVVDGKSLMGLMSIDVSQGITVEYPKEASDFEKFILQFE